MNEQPSVNFIQPTYRFRIGEKIMTEKSAKNKSIDTHKISRIKLVSYDAQQPRMINRLSALSLSKLPNHIDLKGKIIVLKDDLKRIETQYEQQRFRKSRITNIKPLKTISSQIDLGNFPQKLLLKPTWEIQPVSNKNIKKKAKKIHTSRLQNNQEAIQSTYFPIIEKYKRMKSYYDVLPKQTKTAKNSTFEERGQISIVKKYRKTKYFKKLKKAFHVVLFTVYLRSFNQRMRIQRKTYFQEYLQSQIQSKLIDLKNTIIHVSQPFFFALKNVDYYCGQIKSSQQKMRRQKIRTIKRLVSLEVECLEDLARQINLISEFRQILYYLCKHGNYSCLYALNSPEELGLLCVSKLHGYVSSDCYLQKSSILSLLFLKLLLFNILLQAQKLDFPSFTPLQCKNLKLAGNILYELFIDVQDELFQASSAIYIIGNWQKLKQRFHFKTAQPMVLGEKDKGKEVIYGLADHTYIRSVYQTKQMRKNKEIVRRIIENIHQIIVKYHLQIRQKCFY